MTIAFEKAMNLIFEGNIVLIDIILVTLKMSITSSIVALLIGVPLGVLFGSTSFRGKKIIIVLNRTMMGLPPVVCGLLCYLMFCGVGPLRHMHLLYTVTGMVIAQIILITPVVVGSIEPFVSGIYPEIKETAIGLGLSKGKTIGLIINESTYQIVSTYLLGFSRALAEVGAVSMVGGAIVFKTNVMTTAIMNYTNMGDFDMALALGIILMGISLVVNIIVSIMQRRPEF
ncbi:MAG: ABC transporter permease [Firmicutes bacterium]|nr:ABC transporter permease [Bacillota bacterium]